MFHTLHCVNHLRRAYYPEVYFPKTAPKMPDYALMHRDHCIEHVRQYIMCHGDVNNPSFYSFALILLFRDDPCLSFTSRSKKSRTDHS